MTQGFVYQTAVPPSDGQQVVVMTAQQLQDCLNNAPGALFPINYALLVEVEPGAPITNPTQAPPGTTYIEAGVFTITAKTFTVT